MSLEVDRWVASPSAYVHIPFCSAVCPYCDFAVVAGADHLAERYAEAVVAEIEMSPVWRPLESVYFGGGTPSHIRPALLGAILDAIRSRHGVSDGAEVSLEANPEDFRPERAGELRALGFNRVSFGAQSFDSSVLVRLGRRHDAGQIASSVGAAREAGFANVSVDLIFGTPGETPGSWDQTVSEAVALGPDHISCYALTVEPGTPLGRAVRHGAQAPDPDDQADRYETAAERLEPAGYRRYEVSNWARPGKECRYNLTVWAQGEFEAYGNGAHRYRAGERGRNIRRLDAYIERVESGSLPQAGSERIDGWEAEIDRLFVGLRRSQGVANGPGVRALLESADGRRLTAAGLIALDHDRLVVTNPLLTDEVNRAVLSLDEHSGGSGGNGR